MFGDEIGRSIGRPATLWTAVVDRKPNCYALVNRLRSRCYESVFNSYWWRTLEMSLFNFWCTVICDRKAFTEIKAYQMVTKCSLWKTFVIYPGLPAKKEKNLFCACWSTSWVSHYEQAYICAGFCSMCFCLSLLLCCSYLIFTYQFVW